MEMLLEFQLQKRASAKAKNAALKIILKSKERAFNFFKYLSESRKEIPPQKTPASNSQDWITPSGSLR